MTSASSLPDSVPQFTGMPQSTILKSPNKKKKEAELLSKLVYSNFADMAESSTGGGGGISRPYGTFVAPRAGDGCALWQRLPPPRFTPATTYHDPTPWKAHSTRDCGSGRNISQSNITKGSFQSRKMAERGPQIYSRHNYKGVDRVAADAEDSRLFRETPHPGASPAGCKPGCWMCTRNAENQRDTLQFLTEVSDTEGARPLPMPDLFDRFGRPLGTHSAGPTSGFEKHLSNTILYGKSTRNTFGSLPPERSLPRYRPPPSR
ncbi:hypothetical protein CYMTET_19780 [Cymbomonas tetramitiformis]|uniref:Uncharacterized protein n=1 Tax=Cymbomonas tetramitiformis TaxID=36881 RepID=A0AAE0L4V9_9CHLO|nr:hypothetical protein CYMTET_19780 [Cymbomonas tetramitiformis]